MKTLGISGIFLTLAAMLIPQASAADDLRDLCQTTAAPQVFCATAVDFGPQAAHLRGLLLDRRFAPGQRDSGTILSSQGQATPISGFLSLGAQRTRGNFTGSTESLVLGADLATAAGPVAGLMIQAARAEVTTPGATTIRREELLVGPYLAMELAPMSYLDAYLLVGRPDYSQPVATRGTTVMGSATLSRVMQAERLDHVLYASLSVKRETPGNDRINAEIVTLGSSLRFQDRRTGNGWQQNFARLELDFGRFRDSFTSSQVTYVAPRAVLGTDMAFDNGGRLNLSLTGSAATDRTTIVGLQAMYRQSF